MNSDDRVPDSNSNAASPTVTNLSPLTRARKRPKYNLPVKGAPPVDAMGPADIVTINKSVPHKTHIHPKWDSKYLYQDGQEEPKFAVETSLTETDEEEPEAGEVVDPVIEHDSLVAYVCKSGGEKRWHFGKARRFYSPSGRYGCTLGFRNDVVYTVKGSWIRLLSNWPDLFRLNSRVLAVYPGSAVFLSGTLIDRDKRMGIVRFDGSDRIGPTEPVDLEVPFALTSTGIFPLMLRQG